MMHDIVFAPQAVARIRDIHRVSKFYNEKIQHEHSLKLLQLMRHHVEEIQDLWEGHDRHVLVETGDLIVLCLELLLEYDVSLDEILQTCFSRYEKKLGGLLSELEGRA